MKEWQLQTAKAKFSELVKQAKHKGPQAVSVHGAIAVVVISYEEYESLATPHTSLVTFMQQSPLVGLDLEFPRDRSTIRETDL